jgi:hypothetical protein
LIVSAVTPVADAVRAPDVVSLDAEVLLVDELLLDVEQAEALDTAITSTAIDHQPLGRRMMRLLLV